MHYSVPVQSCAHKDKSVITFNVHLIRFIDRFVFTLHFHCTEIEQQTAISRKSINRFYAVICAAIILGYCTNSLHFN